MASGLVTIIYPVKELAAAKQLFATAFGVPPYIDEAYYVAFNVGGQDVGLDPNGHGKGMTGPVNYWRVDDINEALATLVDDVGGGRQIATVRDADGNPIGLLQDPPGGVA
jgi:predicted enzyme related to lactoylglutathione lyase